MIPKEFMDHIRENYSVGGAEQRLILNILTFVEAQNTAAAALSHPYNPTEALKDLLSGTIGLEDWELESVQFQTGGNHCA